MVTDPTTEVRIDEGTGERIEETTKESICLDPASIKEHFDRIGHFRILVVGRSNAGKTTLLQRVCNTTELPEIYNSEGNKVKYHILSLHRSLTHANSQLDPAIVQGSLEVSWKLDHLVT